MAVLDRERKGNGAERTDHVTITNGLQAIERLEMHSGRIVDGKDEWTACKRAFDGSGEVRLVGGVTLDRLFEKILEHDRVIAGGSRSKFQNERVVVPASCLNRYFDSIGGHVNVGNERCID